MTRSFVICEEFEKSWKRLELGDEEMIQVQNMLLANPSSENYPVPALKNKIGVAAFRTQHFFYGAVIHICDESARQLSTSLGCKYPFPKIFCSYSVVPSSIPSPPVL